MVNAVTTIIYLFITLAYASEYGAIPIGDATKMAENLIGKLAKPLADDSDGQESIALHALQDKSLAGIQDSHGDVVDVLFEPLAIPKQMERRRTHSWPIHQADLANATLGFPGSVVLRPRLRTFGRQVNALAKRAPGIAAACSAFAIDALGDVTAQHMEIREAGTGKFNLQRAIAMGCFSACFSGGLMVPFYQMLEQQFTHGVKRAVFYKTAVSNVAAVPLVVLPAYFACTSLLTGENASVAVQRFRENYVETVRDSTLLSVPVDLFLFSVVPVHLRATVDNIFDYAWSTVVSAAGNRRSSPETVSAATILAGPSRTSMAIAAVIGLFAGSAAFFLAPHLLFSRGDLAFSKRPLLSAGMQ